MSAERAYGAITVLPIDLDGDILPSGSLVVVTHRGKSVECKVVGGDFDGFVFILSNANARVSLVIAC